MMSRVSSRRKIAVLLLAMALTVPWASAAAPRGRVESPAQSLSAQAVWQWLAPLWELISSPWTKAGASLDPNGTTDTQPPPNTTVPNSDAGASPDPNG